jgi:hypothetical protein
MVPQNKQTKKWWRMNYAPFLPLLSFQVWAKIVWAIPNQLFISYFVSKYICFPHHKPIKKNRCPGLMVATTRSQEEVEKFCQKLSESKLRAAFCQAINPASIQLEIWVPDMGTWPLHCWPFWDGDSWWSTKMGWHEILGCHMFSFFQRHTGIQIGDGSFPFGTIGYSGVKTRVLGSWPIPKWKKQEILSATYPSVLISLVVPKHPLRKVVFLSYCLAIVGFVWN